MFGKSAKSTSFVFLIHLVKIRHSKYCKRRSARRRGDPEEGVVTSSSAGQVGLEDRTEEVIVERKAAGQKETSQHTPRSSPGKSNAKPPENRSTNNATDAPTSSTLNKETVVNIASTPVCTATGTPGTEVRINMEASKSSLPESLSPTSARSEPSIYTPNETPQSTLPKSRSTDSLPTPPKTHVSQSDISTFSKEPNLASPLTLSAESCDNVIIKDETGSTPVTAISANEVPISTPADSFSIPKDATEQTNPVALETDATTSSTESCKTPVASGNDVTITVEDDDESKSPSLISENESPSAQVIYTRKESATETTLNMDVKNGMSDEVDNENAVQGTQCDKDDMALKAVPTDEGKPFVTSYFAAHLSFFCFFL